MTQEEVLMILGEILTGAGKLRSSFPSNTPTYQQENCYPYYVWRMTRWYGGKDVRMPVMAEVLIGKDPKRKELDALAKMLAVRFFGTADGATEVWAKAFGIV
jgi:effector-binding domain-containing protein